MNLLYCHDNVYFHTETGEVYSQGQFPYSYFGPFLEAFDEVTVAGRGVPLNYNLDLQRLNSSSGPGIEFALLPNINSLQGLAKHYFDVNEQMKTLVEDADAVVIRAVSDLGWLAYKHAKRMNKPIAMEMAACAWDSTWNHGSLKGKLYAPVRYFRDKNIAANADFVMYVSQSFLQERYPSAGHTASASNVRIKPPQPSVLERRKQRIESTSPSDILTIGLIGTLSHKLKGIDTALRALSEIENHAPGRFLFRILGPGNPEKYRQCAEQLQLSHCVLFDGIIQSGDEVLEWLDHIDIYIQPSFQEGVPRATIEAMSRGCPAIGSSAGGIPELLPSEWLHAPGNAAQLQSLLEAMLNKKSCRREAAEVNFETSKKYASDKLKPIRQSFWADYAGFVKSSTKKRAQERGTSSSHTQPAL